MNVSRKLIFILALSLIGCAHTPPMPGNPAENSIASGEPSTQFIDSDTNGVKTPDPSSSSFQTVNIESRNDASDICPEISITQQESGNSFFPENVDPSVSVSLGSGMDSFDAESEASYRKPISTEETDVSGPESIFDQTMELCEISMEFRQKGELDKALEKLDDAYSLILKADTADDPKINQQVDDLRFMISKRILEIYASRNVVVNGSFNEIPVTLNDHVKREIKLFMNRENGFFVRAYKRSGKFRDKIESELLKAGLPKELSWLPLIESGFTTNALSRARALGLWQFIPSTGYKFGLKRDRYIDERLDPEKSTKAAIAYLKELHGIFGDWATVLAAYNCGEGRVLKIIRSQNVNYLDNFWDLYQRLPRETARYVPRFLATLYMVRNPEKFGLSQIETCSPIQYETLTVSRQVRLKDVAAKIGIEPSVLYELNPELRYKILPAKSYALKIPVGKKEILSAKLEEIPKASPIRQTTYVYHRVRNGETLSTIARKYRVRVRSIVRANNIHRKNFIRVGHVLKIPSKRFSTMTASKRLKKRSGYRTAKSRPLKMFNGTLQHVVKHGDSLWLIARKYGTTTQKIRRLNNLKTSYLDIGQVLKIPERKTKVKRKINEVSANTSSDKLKGRRYEVKNGDVPVDIAKRHNIPLQRFLRINHLTKNSKIYPGQELFLD